MDVKHLLDQLTEELNDENTDIENSSLLETIDDKEIKEDPFSSFQELVNKNNTVNNNSNITK